MLRQHEPIKGTCVHIYTCLFQKQRHRRFDTKRLHNKACFIAILLCVFNCVASIHTRHTAAVCSVWHTNTTQNSAEGAEGYSYPFALHCSESKENPAYSMPAPSRKSSTKCRRIALSQTVELKIGRADGMDDRVSKQAPIIIRLAQ